MKKVLALVLAIVLIAAVCPAVSAYEITSFPVTANNAMIVSLDTGEVLYQKNATEKIYPASITKLMTAAVILDKFPNPQDTEVTMTDSAYKRILGTGSAVLGAKVGEVINGKDALACVLISSAGDVVYAYAEAACGSVEAFVEAMNQKAAELGLTGTHYENPIGLHSEQNYTTVEDIYRLTTYVLKNYPIVSEMGSKARYKIGATNMSKERILVTTNYLIDPNTSYFYQYATGLKTGFTDESGRCLVSTASYNGYNYLAITMNCPTQNGTRTEFTTSRQLFRWAFNEFQYKAVLDINQPAAEIDVRLSTDSDYVSLYPASQVKSILPKEADNSSIMIVPKLVGKSVDAPVKKGDVLGTADVIYAERVIGTVDLIAGNDVKSNFFLVAFDKIIKVLTSTPAKIIGVILLVAALIFVAQVIALNRKKVKKKRNIKYIPYDSEEEAKRKQRLKEKRQSQGRPEYKREDDDII